MKSFKDVLLLGDLPYVAALLLMAAGFYAGSEYNSAPPKIAIVERGHVILEAVLDRQGATPEILEEEIYKPVMTVLKRYADLGYVVIDSSKDEAGHYMIAALPPKTVDITTELREALARPQSTAKIATTPEAATPATSNP